MSISAVMWQGGCKATLGLGKYFLKTQYAYTKKTAYTCFHQFHLNLRRKCNFS